MTKHKNRLSWFVITVAAAISLFNAQAVSAQDQEGPRHHSIADVIKSVAIDPTTYAPAIIGYDATMRDWKTSQPFFRNGFVEHNARFTVSGLPNDTAISDAAGRRQIFLDALSAVELSAAQNLASHLIENGLAARFPQHRKMVTTLSWIQRIGVASLISYQLSAQHYRQASQNIEQANELGLH